MLSVKASIPDVILPAAAVEISKSVANVALEKISAVPDRAPVSAIPSAAVDISKSLATVVAAGTNVATVTGTRAISSLFGRLGGVINIASSTSTTADEPNFMMEKKEISAQDNEEAEIEKGEEPNKLLRLDTGTHGSICVDSFYESALEENDFSMLSKGDGGKLPFEDFSCTSYLSVDDDTLNLVSRYYRNTIEEDEQSDIDWNVLQDIILAITNEDVSFGVALLLAELLEKQSQSITTEEVVEVDHQYESKKDSNAKKSVSNSKITDSDIEETETNLNENDGWENDWSDTQLSDDNDSETAEKVEKQIIRKEMNMAEKLIKDLMEYNGKKSVGFELAVYIASMAILIQELNFSPETVFKIPSQMVFAIARKHVKESHLCDTDELEKCKSCICRIFVKTVKIGKSVYS